MDIQLDEILPDKALQSFIHSYKQGVFNACAHGLFSQQVVPHGYIDLIIHLDEHHCDLVVGNQWQSSPDFTIIGIWTKPYSVQFRYRVNVFWIRFKPEGLYHLLGVPAAVIGNNQAAIRELSGMAFHQVCEQLRETNDNGRRIALVEGFFKQQLHKNNKVNYDYVLRAAAMIRQNQEMSMDELSRQVYIGTRQLERVFKQHMGMSPKVYQRIARLQTAQRLLQGGRRVSFADITYHCGFADQAHFIREFKSFTGETPAVFMNEQETYFVSL